MTTQFGWEWVAAATLLTGIIGLLSLTRPRVEDRRRCFGCSDIAYAFFFPRFEVSKDVTHDAERDAALAELADLRLQVQDSKAELVRRRELRDGLTLAAGGNSSAAASGAVSSDGGNAELSVDELTLLAGVESGSVKLHKLESLTSDCERAVQIRRHFFARLMTRMSARGSAGTGSGSDGGEGIMDIPYHGDALDYKSVLGRNCEAVVGYIPLPVGVIGPISIDGAPLFIPMATTEGCLVASTNRGCKAISASGGCTTVMTRDGMTRAPVIKMPSCARAAELCKWCAIPANVDALAVAFATTTRFGRILNVHGRIAGNLVHLRFECATGDAMGMNMIGKGCKAALGVLEAQFPDATVLALSGNTCTDKKSSATNWILGRGKSIVAEVILPESVIRTVLKSEIDAMVKLNVAKNLEGSALAGTIGGHNAHAANIVGAIFLATGQDAAQVGDSSMALTKMEIVEGEELEQLVEAGICLESVVGQRALRASVTMPAIEVGTVGGGTQLKAQGASSIFFLFPPSSRLAFFISFPLLLPLPPSGVPCNAWRRGRLVGWL